MWKRNRNTNTRYRHLSTWTAMKIRISLFSLTCHLSNIDYLIPIIQKTCFQMCNYKQGLYRTLNAFLIGLVLPIFVNQLWKLTVHEEALRFKRKREKKSMPFLPISTSIVLLLITLFIIQLYSQDFTSSC